MPGNSREQKRREETQRLEKLRLQAERLQQQADNNVRGGEDTHRSQIGGDEGNEAEGDENLQQEIDEGDEGENHHIESEDEDEDAGITAEEAAQTRFDAHNFANEADPETRRLAIVAAQEASAGLELSIAELTAYNQLLEEAGVATVAEQTAIAAAQTRFDAHNFADEADLETHRLAIVAAQEASAGLGLSIAELTAYNQLLEEAGVATVESAFTFHCVNHSRTPSGQAELAQELAEKLLAETQTLSECAEAVSYLLHASEDERFASASSRMEAVFQNATARYVQTRPAVLPALAPAEKARTVAALTPQFAAMPLPQQQVVMDNLTPEERRPLTVVMANLVQTQPAILKELAPAEKAETVAALTPQYLAVPLPQQQAIMDNLTPQERIPLSELVLKASGI